MCVSRDGFVRGRKKGLVGRGMPACAHPPPSRLAQKNVIQLQRRYCCPAHWRQANDTDAIAAPSKMFAPILPAWIKQEHGLAAKRIDGVRQSAFVTVAQIAR
jgi:hypothetical protein